MGSNQKMSLFFKRCPHCSHLTKLKLKWLVITRDQVCENCKQKVLFKNSWMFYLISVPLLSLIARVLCLLGYTCPGPWYKDILMFLLVVPFCLYGSEFFGALHKSR